MGAAVVGAVGPTGGLPGLTDQPVAGVSAFEPESQVMLGEVRVELGKQTRDRTKIDPHNLELVTQSSGGRTD